MTPIDYTKIAETAVTGMGSLEGHLKYFQDDVFGVGAICRAARDVCGGFRKSSRFITATLDPKGVWMETGWFSISRGDVDGTPRIEWQDGSSVIGSYYPDACDPIRVAATIAACYGERVFRAKD